METELHAHGPLAPELATFAQFIGAWDLAWSRPGDPDAPTGVRGRLVFGPVLGGRAVQDVWTVPSTSPPQPGHGFCGSTIRFFDPQIGAWRSTWVEPVNGWVRTFIGREVGGEIHLVSLEEPPLLRWRFTEITQERFVWLGEYSDDEARTWRLEERMVAQRTTGREVATNVRSSGNEPSD
ncbi:hypothetical protein FC770_11795 [Nocardioides jishulii]|uniref:DUF1579 domain-containing protein n=1 Tax=Nocardioides jishulii TaxID=2575440 RepID=A0A4U2YKY4_9ACTN|nr:hypothetical protein FCL41_05160 [Nocardioides jishulii]TKI61867.1 hypothetical protein FC770_11795 [Nocardioides jishulii]